MESIKILVLCTGNSCRSQMAEGWLRHFGNDEVILRSAGVETHGLNPRAVIVMKEAGIDISGHSSDHVDQYSDQSFDYVITVCDHAKEVCPVLPGVSSQIHQSFEDPAKAIGSEEEILGSFRAVRDEIKLFSKKFIADHVR